MNQPLLQRLREEQRLHAEAGETLIEVMIASALMALVVISIVGGVATVVLGASVHRKQADGNTTLVQTMEQLRSPNTPRKCAAVSPSHPYAVDTPLPSGVTIESIEYERIDADPVTGQPTLVWSSALSDCSLTSPNTLQRITLRYATTDGAVSSSLSFLKGKF